MHNLDNTQYIYIHPMFYIVLYIYKNFLQTIFFLEGEGVGYSNDILLAGSYRCFFRPLSGTLGRVAETWVVYCGL